MKIKTIKFKRQIIGFIICVLILAGLNILSMTVPVLKNYGKFRISGFFSVFAGMFFGPAGALGCATGNFISDLYSDLGVADIYGFLANFLLCIIFYHIYYNFSIEILKFVEFLGILWYNIIVTENSAH